MVIDKWSVKTFDMQLFLIVFKDSYINKFNQQSIIEYRYNTFIKQIDKFYY